MGWLPQTRICPAVGIGGGSRLRVLLRARRQPSAALLAQGLVDLAQEHFAFFSTGDVDGEPLTDQELEEREAHAERDAGSPLSRRMDKVENTLVEISRELKKLAGGRAKTVPKKKPKAKATSSVNLKVLVDGLRSRST